MKNIKYVASFVFGVAILAQVYIPSLYAQIETQEDGTSEIVAYLGIEEVAIGTKTSDSITVFPKIFSTFVQNKVEKIEISLTDSYSTTSESNTRVIKTISFNDIVVAPGQNSAAPYSITLKNIPYRDDYRVRITMTDKDGLIEAQKESDPFSFGDASLKDFGNIEILKEHIAYNKVQYTPASGPLIAKTGATTTSAAYVLSIKNKNPKQEVYVGAKVTYVKFNGVNRPYVSDVPEITIRPNTTNTLSIQPHIFSEPGTYVADVVLTYAIENKTTTVDRRFRYMIGDLILNTLNFKEEENRISFQLVGTNQDTNIPEFTEADLASSSVPKMIPERVLTIFASYKNSLNQEIASTTQNATYTLGALNIDLPLDVAAFKSQYQNMSSITLTIMDGDVLLHQKTTPFSLYIPVALPGGLSLQHIWIIMCIVLAIIYICVRNHIGPKTRRVMFWLLLIFITLSSYAWYKTIYAIGPNGNFYIVRSSPISQPSSVYAEPSGFWGKCLEHGYTPITTNYIRHVTTPSPTQEFECMGKTSIKVVSDNPICANSNAYTYFIPRSMTGLTLGGSKTLNYKYLVSGSTGVGSPLQIQFDPYFKGTASLKGQYHNKNGICYSNTGNIEYLFNVEQCNIPPQPDICGCAGARDYVCTNPTTGTTTKTAYAPQCAFSAGCTTSLVGNQGTFTYYAINALGTVRYGNVVRQPVPNPYTTTINVGSTTSRTVYVSDSYDSVQRAVTCSITNDGTTVVSTSTNNVSTSTASTSNSFISTSTDPSIVSFMASPNIVKKGKPCNYAWITDGFDSCGLEVNKVGYPVTGEDASVSVSTDDSLNQLAVLSCTRDAVGTTTPEFNAFATTTCIVTPTVEER